MARNLPVEQRGMIHTVLLDRGGYVSQLWMNTRLATLDERRYAGTLMEVTGDVAPGMRWDGQRFLASPQRIPPEAVADERQRRIDTYFPERFRAQVTALGGANALAMHRYVAEVHRTAERMLLEEPPQDFKDDRHWPTPPLMSDLPVPSRHHESPASALSVTVAPVIHTHAQEPKALVIHQEAPGQAAEPVAADAWALDPNDPLYEHKRALVLAIDTAEQELGAAADDAWREGVAELAALATAARNLAEFEARAGAVTAFVEKAA